MYIYLYMFVYTHVYIYIFTYIHIYISTHIYIYTHTYMYIYTYSYSYIYIYTYMMYIYLQAREDLPQSLQEDAAAIRASIAAEFVHLEHTIFAPNRDVFSAKDFTLARYFWAKECVLSRAYAVEGLGGLVCLLPGIDMANHCGDVAYGTYIHICVYICIDIYMCIYTGIAMANHRGVVAYDK